MTIFTRIKSRLTMRQKPFVIMTTATSPMKPRNRIPGKPRCEERDEEAFGRGVAVWLVDLNRPLTTSGALQAMARSRMIVGLTTTPAIFAESVHTGTGYTDLARSRSRETGRDATYHVAKD